MTPANFARVALAVTLAALVAACGGGSGPEPSPVLGTPAGTPIVNSLDGRWLWVHETFVADGVTRQMTLSVDAQNNVTGTGTWTSGLAAPDKSGAYAGTLAVAGKRLGNDVEFVTTFFFKDQAVNTQRFKGVVGATMMMGSEWVGTDAEVPTAFQRMDPL